jgi:hypothetical protein
VEVTRPDHVWSSDITYVPLGFPPESEPVFMRES